ncbi:MAG: methyl-accepting chemotaxis protein [Gemmatimonadaceae bacterium]|nr:methyl-accepting chemotaxis protein [Gemmatimonadaceae bacterium]
MKAEISLRVRLMVMVGVGAVGTLLVGLAGSYGFQQAHRTAAAITRVGLAQRAQMDADMMHDAIRGDVLAAGNASLRQNLDGIAAAERELAEHAARFRRSLDAVDSLAPTGIADELAAMRPAVDAYITSAEEAIAASRTPGLAADVKLGAFTEQFSALEEKGEAFGDAIGALAIAESSRAETFFRTLQWIGLALILLTVLAGLWLGWRAARRIEEAMTLIRGRVESLANKCIASLRSGLSGLAEGNLDTEMVTGTELLHLPGNDELAQLASQVDQIVLNTQATVKDFERSRAAVQLVLSDIRSLTGAARVGDLGRRAEAAAHAGAYGDVVSGVNQTIDAIVEPIQAALVTLEAVAARDLTARVQGDWRGDHARIAQACDRAAQSLGDALRALRTETVASSSAASEISEAAASLADTSASQAARIEEVSAAVQETAAQSRLVADRAAAARDVAFTAQTRTQQGVVAMEQLAGAVDRIRTTSESTGRIVRTIDEIAFQTNLLALNAAVEAARAGDAGRGFAVVADEVRTLAQRAAEAAKQTSELIDTSVSSAKEGAALAADAVSRFREIGSGVEQVAAVVDEIAAASAEQAQGVESVTNALEAVSELTQRVAASSEESAAAAKELEAAAARSRSRVDEFTLEGGGGLRRAA